MFFFLSLLFSSFCFSSFIHLFTFIVILSSSFSIFFCLYCFLIFSLFSFYWMLPLFSFCSFSSLICSYRHLLCVPSVPSFPFIVMFVFFFIYIYIQPPESRGCWFPSRGSAATVESFAREERESQAHFPLPGRRNGPLPHPPFPTTPYPCSTLSPCAIRE